MVLKIGFESRTWRCGIESKDANCFFFFFSIWLLFRALLVLEELLHFPRLAQFIVYTLHKGLKSRTCCLWIYNTPNDSITKVNGLYAFTGGLFGGLRFLPFWIKQLFWFLESLFMIIEFSFGTNCKLYIKEASMVSRINGWVNIGCLLKFIASETDSSDPPN